MYSPIADEFQSGYKQLVFMVSQIQLSLIALDSMEWQLSELPPLFFFDCPELTHDVVLNRYVCFEIISDYSWRNLTDDTFQGNIRLQGWLEVLNDARLPNFDTRKINHS